MKSMLFGGALMCAGLHSAMAGAQVSDASFRFDGNVDNLVAYDFGTNSYVDTGVNESFDVSGGAGVLPFSRSATGGFPGAYGYAYFPEQSVSVSGSGSLSARGELTFSGFSSANAGLAFPADPDFDVNSSVQVEFTVDAPSEFSIEVTSFFFDNDVGSAGIDLRDSNNVTIFEYFDIFFDPMATGTLQPGVYTLSIDTAGSGSAGVDFSVIPAPTTSALLALAGLAGVRRRR